MGSIITFLSNNYIWFLVITLILVFALIGYLVDTKKDERFTKKIDLKKDFSKRLEAATAMNLSMNDMITDNNKIISENNKDNKEIEPDENKKNIIKDKKTNNK